MGELFSVLQQKVKKELIIIYMLFTLFMVIVLLNKINYNVDGLFSYGLAHSMNGETIQFDDGFSYTLAQSPWISFMTAQRGGRFDFQHVWENQAKDVRPLFYYLILHIICSFFPGKFSLWFAGSINIDFALFTLWVVRRLTYELTNSHNMMWVVSIYFVTSAAICCL